jgi:ParB-like chromosome segregation protein Spo0J
MVQKTKRPPLELPFDEIVDCPVDYLALDYNNPRFEIDFDQKKDTEIDAIRTLCNISDVKELIDSISDNGYLPIEPMIVYKGPSQSKYTVLEGNRRLSALKILRDEKIARELRMSVPKLDSKKLRTTKNIKVFRVKNPLDARAYIGFKHINGPQRWDAYAKAKFATKWHRDFIKEGKTIEDVARQLGDNNDTVRSYVSSILVLEQAEKNDIYNIKEKTSKGKFAFSHLYTALDRPEYREFLGLKQGWNTEPSENPIQKKNLAKLREVLVYMFGSKSDNKPALIKSQNPDIKKLGIVLSNEVSLIKIRNGADLEDAYLSTLNSDDALEKILTDASIILARGTELLPKINTDSFTPALLSLVREIKAQIEILDGYICSKTSKKDN